MMEVGEKEGAAQQPSALARTVVDWSEWEWAGRYVIQV